MPRHRRSNDQTRRQELAAAGGSAMGHARAGVRSAYCPAASCLPSVRATRAKAERPLLLSLPHESAASTSRHEGAPLITGLATSDPSHPSRFSRFHQSEKPRSIHAYGIRAQATRTGTASRPPCPQGSSFHPMTPLRWSPTNLSTTVSRWRRWPAGSRGVLRPHGKASNCRDRTRSKWAGVITGIMEERGTNLLAPYPRNVP